MSRCIASAAAALFVGSLSVSAAAAPDPRSSPCGGEYCANRRGDDIRRLNDAYFSALTSDAERAKMTDIIRAHTTNGVADWSTSATEYFAWRSTELGYTQPAPGKAETSAEIAEAAARQQAGDIEEQRAFRDAAEAAVRAKLVDPNSAEFEWPNGFTQGWWKPFLAKRIYGHITCGWVNAKNRMGGYAGRSAFVVLLDDQHNVEFAQIGESPYDYIEAGCEKISFPPAPQFAESAAAASAGPVSVADELTKLAQLRDKGILTEQEFQAQKAKLLGPK